jgi:hypothetical protein
MKDLLTTLEALHTIFQQQAAKTEQQELLESDVVRAEAFFYCMGIAYGCKIAQLILQNAGPTARLRRLFTGQTDLLNQAIDIANQGARDARQAFLQQWERRLWAGSEVALKDAQAALDDALLKVPK